MTDHHHAKRKISLGHLWKQTRRKISTSHSALSFSQWDHQTDDGTEESSDTRKRKTSIDMSLDAVVGRTNALKISKERKMNRSVSSIPYQMEQEMSAHLIQKKPNRKISTSALPDRISRKIGTSSIAGRIGRKISTSAIPDRVSHKSGTTKHLKKKSFAEIDLDSLFNNDDDNGGYTSSGYCSRKTSASEPEPPSYGCVHYRRKCALVAPCCGKAYVCRICHNDKEQHEINRHVVQEVECLECGTRQGINRSCSNCGVVFGLYFCSVCHLYDDVDKQQFHCDKCGICRVGGRENFFHCDTCDICLHKSSMDTHKCHEKYTHTNCPICMDDLYTSITETYVLNCGHMLHISCLNEMLKTGNFRCPLCGESMVDLADVWRRLDKEIAHTPMPEEFRKLHVGILCKDCHQNSEITFHMIGLKCPACGSYNTCRTELIDKTAEPAKNN